MKKTAILLLALTLLVSNSFASGNLSTDGSQSRKTGTDDNLSTETSKDKKKTTGTRTGQTWSWGGDKQAQEAMKKSANAQASASADMTMPLDVVFISIIAELENGKGDPEIVKNFQTCKIATAPKLPRDFGLMDPEYAQRHSGFIDTTSISALQSVATSNQLIARFADEGAVRQYRDCMAFNGAIAAQAYIYLNSDLEQVKAELAKLDGKGAVATRKVGKVRQRKGKIEADGLDGVKDNNPRAAKIENVNFIGYDDFVLLARSAFYRAAREGVKNQAILAMYDRVVEDKTPIRFDGSITQMLSGSSLIVLSGKPQLVVSGKTMYGDAFAGFQGSYKLSRGWSYSSAIDQLQSTSTFSRYANDVNAYADDAVSKGNGVKAIITKRTAIDQAREAKSGISPTSWLPGLGK